MPTTAFLERIAAVYLGCMLAAISCYQWGKLVIKQDLQEINRPVAQMSVGPAKPSEYAEVNRHLDEFNLKRRWEAENRANLDAALKQKEEAEREAKALAGEIKRLKSEAADEEKSYASAKTRSDRDLQRFEGLAQQRIKQLSEQIKKLEDKKKLLE